MDLAITFPAATSSSGDEECIDFEIINDNDLEFEHGFTLTVSSVSPSVVPVNQNTATVTILDDEGTSIITIFIIFFDNIVQ